MADWDARLYLTFADERTRPARDLLARVPVERASYAVDLGCGPGNSTELLAQRWPAARLEGIDTSDDMLAAARERLPEAKFSKADVGGWTAPFPPDLIFANAVLQWVPRHRDVFPRLLRQVAAGGALAVQMPDNLDEPSHRLMREVAAAGPWSARLGDAAAIRERILPAGAYYDLLAGDAATVDIWRTTYNHALDSPAAIVTWLRSTGLKPFIDPLVDEERAEFLARYEARLAEAYERRCDGKVLLPFPRLFIVARR